MRSENLSILIASPELQGRTKLREVLKHAFYKCSLSYERSVVMVPDRVKESTHERLDFIFLSSAFPSEKLTEIVSAVRESPRKQKPAILVCLNGGNSVSRVADLYMDGVDGFVAEPYTTDDLTALMRTVLARKSQSETTGENAGQNGIKTKKVAEFLAAEAIRLVDVLADQLAQGNETGGYALKDLRTLSGKLSMVQTQDEAIFVDVMVAAFGNAKATRQTSRNRVTAVRKRPTHPGLTVREMMAQRGLEKERMIGILKLTDEDFDKFLLGDLDVDEEMARNLSRAFGLTAREWMKLQQDFNVFRDKLKEPAPGSSRAEP